MGSIADQLSGARLMAQVIDSADGTQSAAGADIRLFIENCKVIIMWTAESDGGSQSMQFSLLDSADNTTFAASSYLPTLAAVTAAAGSVQCKIDTDNCKRYLQLKALTSTTSATFVAAAIIVGMNQVV